MLSELDLGLEPGQDKLEPVPLLDLVHELVDRDRPRDGCEQRLDRRLVAVDVEKASDDLRRPRRVDALNVDLDEVGEPVLVQVKDEVVNVVEAVADDDEGELIGELGFLEKVFDLLGVVKVALAYDAFDLADLTRPRRRLNVLEVDLRVLAKVDDGAEVVVETWSTRVRKLRREVRGDGPPSNVLNDSNISMSRTGPMRSEYLVADCTTTWRFWRMLTRSISLKHSRVCSTVSVPK